MNKAVQKVNHILEIRVSVHVLCVINKQCSRVLVVVFLKLHHSQDKNYGWYDDHLFIFFSQLLLVTGTFIPMYLGRKLEFVCDK